MYQSSRAVVRLLIGLALSVVAFQQTQNTVPAQGFSPSFYAGLRWRMIGPFRGGRSNAVTGVPGQPIAFQQTQNTVPAQGFSPSLYSGLRWRMIGPFRGGRSNAVTGVPGQPNTFYFGSVGGGVWKSENSGRTWTPIFDSQPVASIGAIAVAASNTSVVYVGTGESDMRSQISFGNGVYKSTDAGRTWTHVGLDNTRQIGRILVDPRNADIVFVAALGHAYGANPERA